MGNFRQGSNRDGFVMGSGSGGNRFNGKSGGFKGRSSGGRGGFRDRNSGGFGRRTEMHDVTCDKCGKKCQVPFRPSTNKPVFCNECFRENQGSGSNFNSKNEVRPSQSTQAGISSEQFNQINAKLDKIIKTLKDLEMVEEEDSDEDDEFEED